MAFVIDLTREIAAPPEIVWRVITDLGAYGEWNTFVVRCESTLRPGDPIRMWVHVVPWFAQAQTEMVFEHVPLERLCYGVAAGRFGPIRSRRCHEIRAAAGGRTHYRSHFELAGVAHPIVRLLLGERLRKGFTSMTDALARRAESLVH